MRRYLIAVRPEIAAFALAMEERMKHGDEKHGGEHSYYRAVPSHLFALLEKNVADAEEAVRQIPASGADRRDHQNRAGEQLADIANFAMMLSDNLLCLSLHKTIVAHQAEGEPDVS